MNYYYTQLLYWICIWELQKKRKNEKEEEEEESEQYRWKDEKEREGKTKERDKKEEGKSDEKSFFSLGQETKRFNRGNNTKC